MNNPPSWVYVLPRGGRRRDQTDLWWSLEIFFFFFFGSGNLLQNIVFSWLDVWLSWCFCGRKGLSHAQLLRVSMKTGSQKAFKGQRERQAGWFIHIKGFNSFLPSHWGNIVQEQVVGGWSGWRRRHHPPCHKTPRHQHDQNHASLNWRMRCSSMGREHFNKMSVTYLKPHPD